MRTPPTTYSVPRFMEPRKLAVQGKTIIGKIAPQDCPRLAGAVEAVETPLMLNLRFYKDAQNRVRVEGNITASVSRICQRCLATMEIDLVADVELAVVFSEEEMRNLPREIDPWHLHEENGDIIALAEDELLVMLPIVSSHPEGSCHFPAGYAVNPGGVPEAPKDNPFTILERLKNSSSETS